VGECPERQRGRTVNPLAKPSQVRVLLPPPLSYLSIDFACLFSLNPAPHDKVRE